MMVEQPHASHVLIRGHVFTWEDKAPFVRAGMSVLGALEYDPATDRTKCHECGAWHHGLGNHLKTHGLKRAEYNRRFGLRVRTSLCGLEIRRKHRRLATKAFKRGGNLARVDPENSRTALNAANKARGGGRGTGNHPELDNESGRCRTQSLYRIQILAAQLGHTPTDAERIRIGLGAPILVARFGSVAKAMRLAGLEPNRDGNTRGSVRPLPAGYPGPEEIRRRWEAEMAWPKEYFDSGTIALEQRRN